MLHYTERAAAVADRLNLYIILLLYPHHYTVLESNLRADVRPPIHNIIIYYLYIMIYNNILY